MLSHHGFTVMIVDAKPKPSVKGHVEECRRKGICLVSGKPAFKRGLSMIEYSRFRTALMELPRGERDAFEAKLIRQGKLLPSRQGQRFDLVNVFREEAR